MTKLSNIVRHAETIRSKGSPLSQVKTFSEAVKELWEQKGLGTHVTKDQAFSLCKELSQL